MARRFLNGVALTGTALIGVLSQNAFAQSENASELAMTIYGDNRALIEDVRDITFKRGLNTVVLPGVSSKITAASATFIANGIEITEQNFDYDLLTPQKLMQKAVGDTVTIIRTNPGTGVETREKAKVLAVNICCISNN